MCVKRRIFFSLFTEWESDCLCPGGFNHLHHGIVALNTQNIWVATVTTLQSHSPHLFSLNVYFKWYMSHLMGHRVKRLNRHGLLYPRWYSTRTAAAAAAARRFPRLPTVCVFTGKIRKLVCMLSLALFLSVTHAFSVLSLLNKHSLFSHSRCFMLRALLFQGFCTRSCPHMLNIRPISHFAIRARLLYEMNRSDKDISGLISKWTTACTSARPTCLTHWFLHAFLDPPIISGVLSHVCHAVGTLERVALWQHKTKCTYSALLHCSEPMQ